MDLIIGLTDNELKYRLEFELGCLKDDKKNIQDLKDRIAKTETAVQEIEKELKRRGI